jgi:hypothetical protein
MNLIKLAALLSLALLAGCQADQRNATIHKMQREVPALVTRPDPLPEGTYFAFCFFRDPNPDLYIAVSTDGYTWTEAAGGKPVHSEPKLWLRDPSIARGTDGVFHMVFTGGDDVSIGYSTSTDLVHWTPGRPLAVMKSVRGARSCWAPEIVYDDAQGQWLIAWSSEVDGMFEETRDQAKVNHRLWFTTTRDFRTFAEPRVLLDPGYTCIDATFIRRDGQWHLIFKDERDNPSKKQLRMVTGPTPQGPWSKPSDALTVTRVEAPCAVAVGPAAIVYFDEYRWHRYGAIRSQDMKTWTDVSKLMKFPGGARHGSFFQVPETIGRALMASARPAPQ